MVIKMGWLNLFGDSLITKILGILIIILVLVLVYLSIKKIIIFSEKRRKIKEKKEILEIKRKEKKIMRKLTRDKSHIESKIKILTNKNIPKKSAPKKRKVQRKLKEKKSIPKKVVKKKPVKKKSKKV